VDAEFKRLNDAQFDRAKRALQHVARTFIYYVAEDVIRRTPGFAGPGYAGQAPETTRYIPTGRLRGGWNFTRSPIGRSSKGLTATRTQDGPFSDYGRETLARISSQIEGEHMGGISYLENDVGYGDLIVRGEEGHRNAGPRAWHEDTASSQAALAQKAFRSMRGFR
jgi:hypothetical protein